MDVFKMDISPKIIKINRRVQTVTTVIIPSKYNGILPFDHKVFIGLKNNENKLIMKFVDPENTDFLKKTLTKRSSKTTLQFHITIPSKFLHLFNGSPSCLIEFIDGDIVFTPVQSNQLKK